MPGTQYSPGTSARSRIPGFLMPMRHRDYRLLAVGSLVSLFGDGFFLVAIVLQVLAISNNNPAAMGWVGIAWSASAVLTYLIGGWASDRFERRVVMIVADLVRAAVIGLIGLLGVTGQLELWHVIVLGAMFGSGNAFFNPASTAIVPDLLPSEDLPRANAFLGVARPAMLRLAGPALGGLVVAATMPAVAFLVDSATFLFSASMLALIRTQPAATSAEEGSRSLLANVREGLSFVRTRSWCWAYLLGLGLSLLAWYGPVETLLPYILKINLGLEQAGAAKQLGLILAFGGLGSLLASVVVGQREDLPRRFVVIMYVAEAMAILALAVYGIASQSWQMMIASFVAHGLFAVGQIYWTTMLQRLVPRGLLGRVSSVDWLISIGLIPVSFAVAGTLAQWVDPRHIIVTAALAGSSMMLMLLWVPGVRGPESAPEARAPRVSDGRDSATLDRPVGSTAVDASAAQPGS